MKRFATLATITVLTSAVSAAPFRPFIDAVGVTKDGLIVTTTTSTSTAGPPSPPPSRYGVVVFAADGTVLASFPTDSFGDNKLLDLPRQRRAFDAWLASLRATRVASQPVTKVECVKNPKAGETACPPRNEDGWVPETLVRTANGFAMLSDDWIPGDVRVVEIGPTCVLLMYNGKGHVDGTSAFASPCPAK